MTSCKTKIRSYAISTPFLSILTALGIPVILTCIMGLPPAWSAPPVRPETNSQQDEGAMVAPGKIGDSGYVVPTPEINMKNILGGQPSAPATPAAPVKEPAKETQPKSPVVRTPALPEEQSPGAPEVRKSPPAGEVQEKTVETDQIMSLPFDPANRPGAEIRKTEPPVQTRPKEKVENPLASPPIAPEESIEAKLPKKMVLNRKLTPTVPGLLEVQPRKGIPATTPLERTVMDISGVSLERLPLSARKSPDVLPPDAPQTVADATPPEPPAPELKREPVAPEPQKTEEIPEQPKREPARESVVEPEPEKPAPEDVPAAHETPLAIPAKIASPLEAGALQSRDVRDYLTQTAPILEELSLLMTRAPSLAVADFDPSDPNAVIFPKEIYVKIDAMKRELQILDAKAFAIIPPARYALFHSVIRESIIQTYQACDAMIGYFNERNDENLQKIHSHLIKARELVQKTRLAQG
ncbi:MAG TPA: hypothetical protein VK463_20470 [Desulfomonilaceae bacterium]|nr:hypothetical protein [Desulfomonilaceae bacterium]